MQRYILATETQTVEFTKLDEKTVQVTRTSKVGPWARYLGKEYQETVSVEKQPT